MHFPMNLGFKLSILFPYNKSLSADAFRFFSFCIINLSLSSFSFSSDIINEFEHKELNNYECLLKIFSKCKEKKFNIFWEIMIFIIKKLI